MSFNSVPGVAAVVVAGLLAAGVIANVAGGIAGVPPPNAQRAAPNQMPSVAEAQKCADQADGFYRREGSRLSRQGTSRGYIDQYSPKLGKCFITIIASDYAPSSREFSYYKMSIYDVFAGTLYASYSSSKAGGEPEFVSECRVTLESGRNYHCRSQSEWKVVAAEYR